MNNNISNINFKGYDVLPLRALYMQGLTKPCEKTIFNEMRKIAQKEGVDIFVNTTNKKISNIIDDSDKTVPLSIWAQDRKAFVQNAFGKQILWNIQKKFGVDAETIPQENMFPLNNFEIKTKEYFPRGGDYYLGYKENGEKWLLINGNVIAQEEPYIDTQDNPTENDLQQMFDVKPENIFKIYSEDDIDEFVRPIGYPYILVNDYQEALNDIRKLEEDYPSFLTLYPHMTEYIENRLKDSKEAGTCDELCDKLKEFGFIPIKIAGRYAPDINYINAIAMKNKKDKISYITNSTESEYDGLNHLQNIFKNRLKERIPNVNRVYFVSGGQRTEEDRFYEQDYSQGLQFRNHIMDILANRQGGIHCMTAEVPDFDKIG